MSVINNMLKDLEKRRGSLREPGAVPSHVRVLPAERKGSIAWRALNGAVALACIGALGSYLYEKTPSRVQPLGDAAKPLGSPGAVGPEITRPERGSTAAVIPLETPPAPIATASLVAADPTSAAAARSQEELAADWRRVERNTASPLRAAEAASAGSEYGADPWTKVSLRMDALPAQLWEPTNSAAPNSAAVRSAVPNTSTTRSAAPTNSGRPEIDRKVRDLTTSQLAENEYRLGASLLNQRRYAEAQQQFAAALRQAPAHVGARQALFGLLLQDKRTEEAEQVLQAGLKIDPAQPGFAMALARIQVERGDDAVAVETLQNALHLSQGNPDYAAFLAALLQRQGRHAQAVELYQGALALAPRSGLWFLGLGISLQALNRNTEAQDAFRRARAADGLTGELQAFVDQRLKQVQ